MEHIFSQILQMSFQASIVILCVLVVRMLFREANIPERVVCILWLLPMIRMICPISVTSKVSIVPQVNTEKYVLSQTVDSTAQNISQNRNILGNVTIQQGASEMISSNVLDSSMAETAPSLMRILSIVWIVGIILLLCYSLISIIRLKKNLQESIIVKEFSGKNKIYESDKIETPFVYGFFSPKIYLPSSIWESNYEYVIAHEEAHICRKDHLMKYICFVLTMIHWFNPFAWLMFICLGKDIEMACDEHVVKRIGVENRTEYAETLLTLSSDDRKRLGIPLAFGEGETKGRIVHILKYKNTKRIFVVIAMLIIGIVALVTLTDPEKQVNEAEICETFLRDVFEISEEEYDEYEELEEADPVNAISIWQERYRSYFDENGYESAVRNRALGYGIKTYQAKYELKNIEVEEKSSSSADWYYYKVIVGDNINEIFYYGHIFFSETEKGKITKITPYGVEENYLLEGEQDILFENDELVVTQCKEKKYDDIRAEVRLDGVEFEPKIKKRLLNLEEIEKQTITLSDGNEITIFPSNFDYTSYTGVYSSYEEIETLLEHSLVRNIKQEYPENQNNFYFVYSDFGYINIHIAMFEKENIKIEPSIFFYEGMQGYTNSVFMIEQELIYEKYTTKNGKSVYIFTDSSRKNGMLLLKEDNILYEWIFSASENLIDMNWIRTFADELQ